MDQRPPPIDRIQRYNRSIIDQECGGGSSKENKCVVLDETLLFFPDDIRTTK
jgi:hypothetical protein